MVDGISGVNTGSIKDLPVYQQYYKDYLEYNKACGTNLSFDAYLLLKGRKDYLLQQVENYLEGGGDGINGNTLNGMKYVNNGNSSIYQSQDEDTYYEFDFNDGSYRILHGKDEAAAALGLSGENVDSLKFGFRTVEATDYTFGSLEDGQDSSTSNVSGGLYGGVTYTKQEFDLDYIFNALLMNPNDPQYQIASQIFDDLVDNMKQWCPEDIPDSDLDLAGLDECAAQYGTNSEEYKKLLKKVLLANLDQAKEWAEHSHLEFNPEVSFDPTNGTDGTDGTNGTNGEQQENKAPEYDRTEVLKGTSLYSSYQANNNICGSWHEKGKREETWAQAHQDGVAMMQSYIAELESALKAQIGDAWTPEMNKYLSKVEDHLINGYLETRDQGICDNGRIKNNNYWAASDCKSGGAGDARAVISIRNLCDEFFREFDKICKNGGKTDAEVAAEKKAAEEKAAKEKAGYKSLYEMDMKSVGSEAGVKDVTVVPTSNNQYAEIQEKAQTDIINPLKNKIKEKLKNSNIPEAELDRILTYAEETALANPSNWASTSNNYTYTISSSKLIELFQNAVKSAVKSKGYDF